MLIEQKISSVPRNLALGTFGELSIFNKGNSPIPHLFNGSEVSSSASDKAKFFAEKFSYNSNFDGSGISSPVFLFRTNQNCIIFHRILVVVLKSCQSELSYIPAEF